MANLQTGCIYRVIFKGAEESTALCLSAKAARMSFNAGILEVLEGPNKDQIIYTNLKGEDGSGWSWVDFQPQYEENTLVMVKFHEQGDWVPLLWRKDAMIPTDTTRYPTPTERQVIKEDL
jgi:hypothetical protein